LAHHSKMVGLAMMVFVLLFPQFAQASGIAGNHLFPVTLAVDHPFVCDDLSFTLSHTKEPDRRTDELSFNYAKRITPDLGVELRDAYRIVKPNGEKTHNGFGNADIGARYQFLMNDKHELLLSAGVNAELGNTGSKSVGAASFFTVSPAFFFGKGFGDLPESVKYFRPLAVTGAIGPNFPTRSKNVTTSVDPGTGGIVEGTTWNPITFSWGFTVQYSLQYLQTHIKDIGLGMPFNRMVLLAELPLETCLNRDCTGRTTGFVNPGVIWLGESFQLGIEAQIPINHKTGNHVGGPAMISLFIDDLFPKILGKPIFP